MSQGVKEPAASAWSVRTQIIAITVVAVALYVGLRQLPTGTNLNHLDFRVAGGNSIEFCDPKNPQFIPVVAVPSPVALQLTVNGAAPSRGQTVNVTASLSTSTGKAIGPPDLLVAHTEKLHLLILDPELCDYQHVHPQPGAKAGDWTFSFTPHRTGRYRVFADFTPAATARGLYAGADLQVGEKAGAAQPESRPREPEVPSASTPGSLQVSEGDLIFQLAPAALPLRARAVSDFEFSATTRDGTPVRLEPVMDAYAHLVAVDQNRTGFAHLHPTQLVTNEGATSSYSKLQFKVTIPQAGRYVIWSQVRVGGRDYYAPFWFEVVNG